MRKKRIAISIFILWSFIHAYLFIQGIILRNGSLFTFEGLSFTSEGWKDTPTSTAKHFFPFYDDGYFYEVYDLTEFFLYVGFPGLIYWLYMYLEE